MDKLWKKISGLFFASLMTVALTGRVSAGNEEETLPDAAPPAIIEPASEAPASEPPKTEPAAPAVSASAARRGASR